MVRVMRYGMSSTADRLRQLVSLSPTHSHPQDEGPWRTAMNVIKDAKVPVASTHAYAIMTGVGYASNLDYDANRPESQLVSRVTMRLRSAVRGSPPPDDSVYVELIEGATAVKEDTPLRVKPNDKAPMREKYA